MSTTAKTFTALKNVRNTTATEKTKSVYKNVLGSPFILKWPTIHTDLGQTILTQLLKTLTPVGEYRIKCRALKKKKKVDKPSVITQPEIQSRLHVGINEVTRYMESYIAHTSTHHNTKDTKYPVIYICKREIKPLQLCQHLLSMAALAKIKLIPMPADSESKLGQALGITRASVILIEIMEDKEESLRLSAQEVPLLDAPWLSNALNQKIHFIGDSVKILKTVAPIKTPKKQQPSLKRKADDIDLSSTDNKKLKN